MPIRKARAFQMLAVMVCASMVLVGCASTTAQTLAKTGSEGGAKQAKILRIAGASLSSSSYSMALTMADVLTKAGIPATAEPSGGSTQQLELLRSGQVDMTITTAGNAESAFLGTDEFSKSPPFNDIRTIIPLNTSYFTVTVADKTNIKSPADLKGKRIATVISTPSYKKALSAILASANLTLEDTKVVSVAEIGEAIEKVGNGGSDGYAGTPGGSRAAEIHQKERLRLIVFPTDEAAVKRAQNAYSPIYATSYGPDPLVGLTEKVPMYGYDFLLLGSAKTSEQTIYDVVNTIFKDRDKLISGRKEFKEVTLDRVKSSPIVVPYQNDSIKYLNEKQVWNPTLEQAQSSVLAKAK
ncbi:hypothetical protein JCM15765_34470 [Paradesulfitobacterium aromaticivorans]